MVRKVAVVTGSRAEYGILKNLINLIKEDPILELQLFVTGTHLSNKYGNSINSIKNDGLNPIATIDILLDSDTSSAVGKSISLGIIGFIEKLELFRPDMLVILGDRYESFAIGIAALHLDIHLVHIHGGDLGRAVFDNVYRNSLTQMASINFVATLKSLERVLMMGSSSKYSYLVGSPSQDMIQEIEPYSRDEISGLLGLDQSKRWILVLYHPTKPLEESANIMKNILNCIDELNKESYQCVMIKSNSDAGGQAINEIIMDYVKKSNFYSFDNLNRKEYLSLLSHLILMIGNSSSGLIDTPAYGLPTIDVGTRQKGRERGSNVVDVSGEISQIRKAITQSLQTEETELNTYNPYKFVNSSKMMLNLIKKIDFPDRETIGEFEDNFEIIAKLRAIKKDGIDHFYGKNAKEITEMEK